MMLAAIECIVLAGGMACAPMSPEHHEAAPVVDPDPYVVYLDKCMQDKVDAFAMGMHDRGASDEVIEKHVMRLLGGSVRDEWLKQCAGAYKK